MELATAGSNLGNWSAKEDNGVILVASRKKKNKQIIRVTDLKIA
jgi:hypothetical protein